jgi:ABC-type Mn2+/Zn2+ transport system permease subunit
MTAFLRRLSPRAEKTIRLVVVCAVAAVVGILAVTRGSEALGYAAAGIVLAGILAGPLVARALTPKGNGPR